jgi:dynein heavy chain, axonemal
MLGAGTDPLAREGGFSILAGNANNLINAQFIKPNPLRIRFPPVLDKFSRTIGAPVSALKYNLPPSMRIGSNFTPSARMLYIDQESKCVKNLKKMDNTITFSANPEYLQ